MPTTPERPRVVLHEDGTIEVTRGRMEASPEQRAARKAVGARCGHIKRKLLQGDVSKGELLELALEVARDEDIAAKLKAGQKLNDYEMHLMVDVFLLHARLGAN